MLGRSALIRLLIAMFLVLSPVFLYAGTAMSADIPAEDQRVCLDVLTRAHNVLTGEVRVFSTSCIPYGWELVSQDIFDIREEQIKKIIQIASLLAADKIDELYTETRQPRSQIEERFTSLAYLKNASEDLKKLSEKKQDAIIAFVTYGVDDNSRHLGRGARAAVVYSYLAAYHKLPQTESEFADMIKIANGRFPAERNQKSEKVARKEFTHIYQRVGNSENIHDSAALMVMTYGLQQLAQNRNLASERQGIKIFATLYGFLPRTINAWNIVSAITYSGATRKKDSDRDLLSDDDEKQLGTDPYNPDTDGDGISDGVEVERGSNPLKRGM